MQPAGGRPKIHKNSLNIREYSPAYSLKFSTKPGLFLLNIIVLPFPARLNNNNGKIHEYSVNALYAAEYSLEYSLEYGPLHIHSGICEALRVAHVHESTDRLQNRTRARILPTFTARQAAARGPGRS